VCEIYEPLPGAAELIGESRPFAADQHRYRPAEAMALRSGSSQPSGAIGLSVPVLYEDMQEAAVAGHEQGRMVVAHALAVRAAASAVPGPARRGGHGRSLDRRGPVEFLADVIRWTIINLVSRAVVYALVAGATRLRRSWRPRQGE
jgi:hypothetical protein